MTINATTDRPLLYKAVTWRMRPSRCMLELSRVAQAVQTMAIVVQK